MPKEGNEKKRSLRILLLLGVFFLLLGAGALVVYFLTLHHVKRTTDAYVQGNKVVITPLVDGFIKSIYTDDTFLVEKGQLIIELDSTNARLAYQESKDNYAKAVREVCALYHATFAYDADIQIREAEWIKAEEFYNHRFNVLDEGAVSLEDFQQSKADLDRTYYAFLNAQSLYQSVVSQIIGRSIRNNPRVKEAEEKLSQAWVNLYRCQIFSPVRGLVAQRDAQVGMWISSGTPLLSVIPLDQIWVNTNYKETQMKHMKIGQRVELKSDMYGGDVVYQGTIVGLPGGAGNAFSILPPQNLSGNWIKVVQRLPVRVELDEEDLTKYPLRIGMTMRAKVDVRERAGSYLPKSGEEAPVYQTNIYNREIEKSKAHINRIFLENADPSLEPYYYQPFYPENES